MKPFASIRSQYHGFTLIELLVVMAILGVLAAAVMPLGETLLVAQKERDLRRSLTEIRSALDAYKKVSDQNLGTGIPSSSGYPPSLQALVDGLTDSRPQTKGRTVYFLRAIPRDPFADAQLPADQTWKLRSYASPANRPEPGADVYDVHSSSAKKALDGTLYAQW
jgi:general secretion pathway protein G